MKRISYALFTCLVPGTSFDLQAYASKQLITHWVNDSSTFTVENRRFKQAAIFESFDKTFFNTHQLPTTKLIFRNSDKYVLGSHLNNLIEGALQELRRGEKITHFTIIKEYEFDRTRCAGCLVLKFNDYPFVLKLFMEAPETFLRPADKGFRHKQMSLISGGINRYLAGFGRIKNLQETQKLIAQYPEYAAKLDFPRKWFWQPKNNRWFRVSGAGFIEKKLAVELPEVYGIVADEIVSQAPLHYIRKHHGRDIFKICQKLKFSIDPNMKNFRVEKDTGKLVIIDTEHFPSLLGLEHELIVDNYLSLHLYIGYKVIKDHLS